MKLIACFKDSIRVDFKGYINIEHIVKIGTSYRPYHSDKVYYNVLLINGEIVLIDESDHDLILKEYLVKSR